MDEENEPRDVKVLLMDFKHAGYFTLSYYYIINVSPQHVILKAAEPLEGSPECGTSFNFLKSLAKNYLVMIKYTHARLRRNHINTFSQNC